MSAPEQLVDSGVVVEENEPIPPGILFEKWAEVMARNEHPEFAEDLKEFAEVEFAENGQSRTVDLDEARSRSDRSADELLEAVANGELEAADALEQLTSEGPT